MSLRQQRNVYYDALLYRKHPRLYRQRIRPVPPWDYYAIVILAVLCVARVGSASASVDGGWLPGAAALALIVRFALRRLRGASRAPAHVLEMLATSALIPFLSVWWRLRGAWRFRTWFF